MLIYLCLTSCVRRKWTPDHSFFSFFFINSRRTARRLWTSLLFGLLVSPQQAAVQAQKGVTHTQRTVHWGHQQGQEGQLLLPRRQRDDDLADNRHRNEPEQVDRLQRMKQWALATDRGVISLPEDSSVTLRAWFTQTQLQPPSAPNVLYHSPSLSAPSQHLIHKAHRANGVRVRTRWRTFLSGETAILVLDIHAQQHTWHYNAFLSQQSLLPWSPGSPSVCEYRF